MIELVEETPWRWRIERMGDMRVPGIVFASHAMPDVHWGYGFPFGGMAATDVEEGGVVSPGGVGFDISCGVRLLPARLDRVELEPYRTALMDQPGRWCPTGWDAARCGRSAARASCAASSPGCHRGAGARLGRRP